VAAIDLSFGVNEQDFRKYVCEHLWDSIDPAAPLIRGGAPEVRIGAFKLDLLSANRDGGLSVVEFKVCASNEAVHQLFLYPRAVKKALERDGGPIPSLRAVLVTPFLDRGVVEAVRSLGGLPCPMVFRLCVPDGMGGAVLRDPEREPVPGDRYWDQVDEGRRDLRSENGHVMVRGERLM
jgi:hypothetical protein